MWLVLVLLRCRPPVVEQQYIPPVDHLQKKRERWWREIVDKWKREMVEKMEINREKEGDGERGRRKGGWKESRNDDRGIVFYL